MSLANHKHACVHWLCSVIGVQRCRATEALCAGLAVELRLALANQHSSTFRYDPVLLPADEAAAAQAFAAWPAAYDRTRHMTNNEAHVRAARLPHASISLSNKGPSRERPRCLLCGRGCPGAGSPCLAHPDCRPLGP